MGVETYLLETKAYLPNLPPELEREAIPQGLYLLQDKFKFREIKVLGGQDN